MHDEGNDWVVVVQVGLTKVNVCTVDNGVKVTMLIQNEVSLKVKLEVFEYEFHCALVWQEPEVYILVCINLPMLDCWELDVHEGFVKRTRQ